MDYGSIIDELVLEDAESKANPIADPEQESDLDKSIGKAISTPGADYGSIIDELELDEETPRVDPSVHKVIAETSTPGTEAEIAGLADRLALPADYIRRDLAGAKRFDELSHINQVTGGAPATAKFLSIPSNLAATRDDVQALADLEKGFFLMDFLNVTGDQFGAGVGDLLKGNEAVYMKYDSAKPEDLDRFKRSIVGMTDAPKFYQQVHDNLQKGMDQVLAEKAALETIQEEIAKGYWGELARQDRYVLADENMKSFGLLGDAWFGLVRSAPAMAGSFLGGVPGVATVYQQLYGAKYDELVKAGASELDATRGAQATAMYSAPLEFLGNTLQIKALMKGVSGKKLGDFLLGLMESMGGEALEEYSQQFADEWGNLVAANPDATGEELFQEFLSRVPEIATSDESIYAAQVGGLGGAILPVAGKAIRTPIDLARYVIRKNQAEKFADQQQTLADLVRKVKISETNPALMQKFLEDHLGLKDQDAFIEPEAILELHQSQTEIFEEVVSQLGAEKEQIVQAAENGQAIRLSLSAFHSKLSPDAQKVLFQSMKASPGAYSVRQVQEGLTQTEEEFEERYGAFLVENEELAQEVSRIEQESVAAGANPTVARETAQVAARMAISLAERTTDGRAAQILRKIQFGQAELIDALRDQTLEESHEGNIDSRARSIRSLVRVPAAARVRHPADSVGQYEEAQPPRPDGHPALPGENQTGEYSPADIMYSSAPDVKKKRWSDKAARRNVSLAEAEEMGMISGEERQTIEEILKIFPNAWEKHFEPRFSDEQMAPSEEQFTAHKTPKKERESGTAFVAGTLLTEKIDAIGADSRHLAVMFRGSDLGTFLHEFGEFIHERCLTGETRGERDGELVKRMYNIAKKDLRGSKILIKKDGKKFAVFADSTRLGKKHDTIKAAKEDLKLNKRVYTGIVNQGKTTNKERNEWFADSFKSWFLDEVVPARGVSRFLPPELTALFRRTLKAARNVWRKLKGNGKTFSGLDPLFSSLIFDGREINEIYNYSTKEAVINYVVGDIPSHDQILGQGFHSNSKTFVSFDPGTICPKQRDLVDFGLQYTYGRTREEQRQMPDDDPSWAELAKPAFWAEMFNLANEGGVDVPCLYCYVEDARREALTKQEAGKSKNSVNFAMAKKVTESVEYVDKLVAKYADGRYKFPQEKIDEMNKRGGLRLFSFSDYIRDLHKDTIARLLRDAHERGLAVKAITKNPHFVEDFANTGIVVNLSIDIMEDGSMGGLPWAKAGELKAKYPNVKIRTVAVNTENYKYFAKLKDMHGVTGNFVDVITPYHGKVPEGSTWGGHPWENLDHKTGKGRVLGKMIKEDPEGLGLQERTCCQVGGKCYDSSHHQQCASNCHGFAGNLTIPDIKTLPDDGGVPKILYQSEQEEEVAQPKGRVQIYPDKYVIDLFSRADASTPFHELGHVFLEEMITAVNQGAATEQLKSDLQTLLDWFGIDSADQIEVHHHEQLARGFEAYLMEGQPPLPELLPAFKRFSRWLKEIYKHVKSLNVALNKDVREVFDRMLVAEQQTDVAVENLGLTPLTKKELDILGVLPEDREYMARLLDDAMEEAERMLLSAKLKGFKDNREKWEEEAQREVDEDIMHSVVRKLKKGAGIDRDLAVSLWGPEAIDRMPAGLKSIFRKDGMNPDEVAYEDGFNSAEQLLDALEGYVPEDQAMKKIIEKKKDDFEASLVAEEYVLDSDSYAEYLGILGNYTTGKMGEEARMQERLTGRKGSGKVMARAAFTRYAKSIIADMSLKDALRTDLFMNAVKRSANQERWAIKRGDWARARRENENLRLNFELARESRKIRRQKESIERYGKRLKKMNPADVAVNYLGAALKMFERFKLIQLNRNHEPIVEEAGTVRHLLTDDNDEMGPESFGFSDRLVDTNEFMDYRDLAIGELLEIQDIVKALIAKGRDVMNPVLTSLNRTMEDVRLDLLEATDQLVDKPKWEKRGKTFFGLDPKEWLRKLQDTKRNLFADTYHLWSMIRILDGFSYYRGETGPWEAYLRDNLEAAYERKSRDTRHYMPMIQEAFDVLFKRGKELPAWLRINVPVPYTLEQDGQRWNYEAVVAVALNMGNQSNLDRLKDGYGWTDEDLYEITSILTDEEWDAIQRVWDIFEEMRPEFFEASKRIHGVAPPRIKPKPFVTGTGKVMRGGYVPAVYDSSNVRGAELDEKQLLKESANAAFQRPAVNKRATKSRAVSAGRMPIRLDISGIVRQFEYNLQYTAFAEVVRDLSRIMNDQQIANKITEKVGSEFLPAMRYIMSNVANPGREAAIDTITKLMKGFGVKASKYILGLNRGVGVKQVFSLPAVWVEGGAWFKGLQHIMKNPRAAYQEMLELSPNMRERMEGKQVDREVLSQRAQLQARSDLKGVPDELIDSVVFVFIRIFDTLATFPAWWGTKAKMERKYGPGLEAIRQTDKIIFDTQPISREMDMSRIQLNRNGLARLLTFFSGFTMKYENRKRVYAIGYRQGLISPKQFMKHVFLERILPPLLMNLLFTAGAGDEVEADDVMWDILLYQVCGFPVVRELAVVLSNSIRYGYDEEFSSFSAIGSPMSTVPAAIESAANSVGRLFGDDADHGDVGLALVELLFGIKGIPAVRVYRELEESWRQYQHSDGFDAFFKLFVKPDPKEKE